MAKKQATAKSSSSAVKAAGPKVKAPAAVGAKKAKGRK